MTVDVRIPAQLRRLFDAAPAVALLPGSLTGVLEQLDREYPGIKDRLLEPGGDLRRYVNVFVDGEDVRWLDGASTTIVDGAEIRIVPSIAGG